MSGRSRLLAVLAVLAGAGLVVLAAGRSWVTVTLPAGAAAVHADGRAAAPGAVAIALVAAAGGVVLATAGAAVRTVVAGLLLLAGLGVAALSVPVWQAPEDAAAASVSRVTGTVGQPAGGSAGATAWPAISAAGGLLVAAGGVTGLLRGRRWAGPSRRFDAPGAPVAAGAAPPGLPERDRRLDAWDSLSRGEDPTDPAG